MKILINSDILKITRYFLMNYQRSGITYIVFSSLEADLFALLGMSVFLVETMDGI